MAIRVVARIRPQHSHELGKDVIVSAASKFSVKVPNPKNEGEDFTFQFSSVYDKDTSQQQIFDNESKREVRNKWHERLTHCSITYGQAPLQWIRRHDIRIWQHRDGQDSCT